MRTPLRGIAAILAIVLMAACGGRQEPEQPAPQPAPEPAAPPPAPAPEPAPAPAPVQPAGEDPAAAAARITAAVLTEVRSMVHFDFDKSDIRPEDRGTLDLKAAILGTNGGMRLRISGHADERGSDEYNLALGTRRATAVKIYLANKGVEGGRLEVVSYGEEQPIATGHDEDSWFQNRRAEFEVTAGGTNLRMP
jgi:peptidoglycan-associated lipoprotein